MLHVQYLCKKKKTYKKMIIKYLLVYFLFQNVAYKTKNDKCGGLPQRHFVWQGMQFRNSKYQRRATLYAPHHYKCGNMYSIFCSYIQTV